MTNPRVVPAPHPHPDTQAFWEAAEKRQFLIRTCTACGRAHWYPRTICPFCASATRWTEASGRGIIYAFSIMRRAEVPYAIGYVTLTEGPSMLTNFVQCDFERLAIGQDVKVVFIPSHNGPLVPAFTPVSA